MNKTNWAEFATSEENTLDRIAFMIAKLLQYPSLDIEQEVGKLDAMGMELKTHVGSKERPTEVINSINDYLFEKKRFQGNSEDYYDPRNSFLNDVIIQRKGIPITLSVLYMELAKRIGFSLHGVGFPGHFMVKHVYHDFAIIVDPFNKGRILSNEDLQRLLDQLYNGQLRLDQRFLNPVTKQQILIRMLRNLKDAYMQSYDYDRALSATDMVIALEPNLAEEVRDKGLIFYQKKLYGDALLNLAKYLEMQPDASDADNIVRAIQDIQSLYRHDMYK